MQECLTTFENELGSVTLIPSKPPSPGGTFLVKLDNVILWDRTVEKSFPEAKLIKQRIRDQISPTKDLGHSDVKNVGLSVVEPSPSSIKASGEKCIECEEQRARDDAMMIGNVQQQEEDLALVENRSLPSVNVIYCNDSKWMMRATWICQEILATFQDEVRSVTLIPIRSLTEETRETFVSTAH
jgi:selenoprotein W-related protein